MIDMTPPTVFLDRDGTINREVHHLSDPEQLELLPGAADGLRALYNAGCELVVVSNQSPIGRGLLTENRLREINARLADMLQVQIAGWYCCPHTPWDGCDCRKPAPGMFLRARDEMGVKLEKSWVIGDRLADLQAGRQVGARTILVATGYGRDEYALPERAASVDYFVPTLREAAEVIVNAKIRDRLGSAVASVTSPSQSQLDESALLCHARDHLLASAETKRLYAETSAGDLVAVARLIAECFAGGSKLMLCGNGGSAADCQHIAAEFTSVLSQKFNRRALPAIALTTDTSFLTARGNDYGFDSVFSRQVEALGKRGDVLMGTSTSGNAQNVLLAFEVARRLGLKTIGLTGSSGGKMVDAADMCLRVPSDQTAHIQESHIAMGHVIVAIVEKYLFNSDGSNRASGK
jgi:D-sedoheptulose 7-phosphate isomerase